MLLLLFSCLARADQEMEAPTKCLGRTKQEVNLNMADGDLPGWATKLALQKESVTTSMRQTLRNLMVLYLIQDTLGEAIAAWTRSIRP
jgi:hypothetical protein